jgi:hypothetical protein
MSPQIMGADYLCYEEGLNILIKTVKNGYSVTISGATELVMKKSDITDEQRREMIKKGLEAGMKYAEAQEGFCDIWRDQDEARRMEEAALVSVLQTMEGAMRDMGSRISEINGTYIFATVPEVMEFVHKVLDKEGREIE